MSQSDNLVRYNRATDRNQLPKSSEIWSHRYLIIQLVLREFKARYTQSVLGILWIAIAPIVTMLVFTFVFRRLAEVPSYNIPYPVFSFAALVPWGFFQSGINLGSKSVLTYRQFITDVYIPRIIIPFLTQFTGLVDMLINFFVFMILMLIFGILPSVNSIFLIPLTLQLFILSTGISLISSALHVRFRDIQPLIGYILQVAVFLSPVAYPTEIVDDQLRTLYSLNPMVGILDTWRWAILGTDTLHLPTIFISVIITLVIFVIGLTFYTRSESTFVDWI